MSNELMKVYYLQPLLATFKIMARIDKIYGTQEQYIELEKWLNDNNKKAISGLYPKEGYDKEYRPISNFSVKIDKWLLDNCPLTWVTDKIKWQYGI